MGHVKLLHVRLTQEHSISLLLSCKIWQSMHYASGGTVNFILVYALDTNLFLQASDSLHFLISQVIVHSQVKASLTIYDAWLDLQDGFAYSGKGDGRPISAFFPLTISSKSTAAILFSICLENTWAKGVTSCPLSLSLSFMHSTVSVYKYIDEY